MPNRKATRHRAAAILAVALCSACSPANSSPPGISPDAVAREFRGEQVHLALAPNWKWPNDPTPARTSNVDGAPLVYEQGYGVTAADHYWYCSWESHYLELKDNTPERNDTYSILLTVRKTEYYQVSLLPQDKTTFDKELNAAGSGDLSLMKADVALNCPHIRPSMP